MEKTKERSTVIFAILALVVIGLSLLASTWQTLNHQREAEEQHLFLTTRAVLLAVESSIRRGPVRAGENRLTPRTAEFFQALEQDGDVLFVGIIDSTGGQLLTSPVHGTAPVTLPGSMVTTMIQDGEWHGRLVIGGQSAYFYGKKLAPLRGMHMSLRDSLGPPGFLVVAIDMEKHLSAYKGFSKNALFQAIYILAAALFTWGLGVSFLARREQAKKAAALERFQSKLLDNLPDGLITVDAEHIIRAANPAALKILKRSPQEVLGKPASTLPSGITTCAAPNKNSNPQCLWQRMFFEHAHLEILSLPLADDKENAFLIIIRDRTQLHTLEKSLAHAEKLAAIGTLAAGVAHEVRNPLSALRGFAQYFVKKLAGRKPEEDYAKTMVNEADRLNRVITDLLFLARPKKLAPQQIDLHKLVAEIILLLRFDLEQKNIRIQTAVETPTVFADADALKQVILNLLLNSLDAIDSQASQKATPVQVPLLPAEIETPTGADEHIAPEKAPAASLLLSPDAVLSQEVLSRMPTFPAASASSSPLIVAAQENADGVWLCIRDAGCGMTQEHLQQAFEPFFTAKERGTGLGLALVQRTMLDHGGSARIESSPGNGCSVYLYFPTTPVIPVTDATLSGDMQ